MVRSLIRSEPIEHQVGTDKTFNIPLYDESGPLDVTGKTGEFKLYPAVPRRGRKPWTGNALFETSPVLTTGNAAVTITNIDLDGKSGPHWYSILITTTASGAIAHGAEGEIMLRRAP